MKQMQIEQIDVWTFGDGRPFEAGEDHQRLSMFPPTSLTLQGALRAKVLADSGVSFEAFRQKDPACATVARQIGWPDDDGWGQLRLRGPWLVKDGERYYPIPADVVEVEELAAENEKAAKHLLRLSPLKDTAGFQTNLPDSLHPLWVKTTGVPTESTGWLSATEFKKYLEERVFHATQPAELFSRESRFGVEIESAVKRPKTGNLFAMEYIRLNEGVTLQVEVDGLDLPQTGLLALGGDGRTARYKIGGPGEALLPIDLPARFKIVFVTPAYFERGWQPADWAKWFAGARLVAAALKRPTPIGGRNVAKNEPRSLRKFIPAGSVYYFESEARIRYQHQPITDFGAEIGFGQIITGGWNYV